MLLTGKLGPVMQESAQAALSLVKSLSKQFRLSDRTFKKNDLHVHIPEGAVPKDGPSAGIALATALASALTGRAVRKDIAMTGEVTLGGRVLPIGGLKEKVLASFRDGVKTVLYPEANRKDLPEIAEDVRKAMKLVPVKNIDEVFKIALS
jgi:ATP-dependent Lon protease